MPAYVFQSIGTWVVGTGNLTPVIPTFTPGWLAVLVSANSNASSETATVPAGWTQQSANINGLSTYLWTRVLQAGDANPTVTWTAGGWQSQAVIALFSGDVYPDQATIKDVANDRVSNSSNQLALPSHTPALNNDLLIAFTGRQKTATTNGATVGTVTNFTKPAGGDSVPNGTQFACTFQYWQQTDATNSPLGSAIYSNTGDGGQTTNGLIVSLKSLFTTGLGQVPTPGNPALSSPSNRLQFKGVPGYQIAPAIPAPIEGVFASTSVVYAPINRFAFLSQGFVKQPGPGNFEPFNNNQFLTLTDGGSNFPSPTTASIAGFFDGASVAYGTANSFGSNLSGIWASSSTIYGPVSGIIAGTTGGLIDGTSVFYAAIGASGDLVGEWDSSSLVFMQGIGGSFQPFVPMTAVVDVRLGIGYQPWRVRPVGTSG